MIKPILKENWRLRHDHAYTKRLASENRVMDLFIKEIEEAFEKRRMYNYYESREQWIEADREVSVRLRRFSAFILRRKMKW